MEFKFEKPSGKRIADLFVGIKLCAAGNNNGGGTYSE
jgi:hypothetical protein